MNVVVDHTFRKRVRANGPERNVERPHTSRFQIPMTWHFDLVASDVIAGTDEAVCQKVDQMFAFDHKEVPTRSSKMVAFKACILAGGGLCSMELMSTRCANATCNLYSIFGTHGLAKNAKLPVLARFQVPGADSDYYWVCKFADRGALAFLVGAEARNFQVESPDIFSYVVRAAADGNPVVSSSNVIFSTMLEKAAAKLNRFASDLDEIYLEVFHTRRSKHGVGFAVEIVDARFIEALKLNVRNITKAEKASDIIRLPFGLSVNVKDVVKEGAADVAVPGPQSDGSDGEEGVLHARDVEESDFVDSGSSDDGQSFPDDMVDAGVVPAAAPEDVGMLALGIYFRLIKGPITNGSWFINHRLDRLHCYLI